MDIRTLSAPLILAAALMTACSAHQTRPMAPAKLADGVLAGGNGMTLYVFDKDAAGSGKSVCNGPCATNWPPLHVMPGEAPTGDYSIVARDDGKQQWAYKGKPLYFWVKDQKPGDKTGDGVNNVWHAARP